MAEKSDSPGSGSSTTGQEAEPFLTSFLYEIIRSPVNLVLVAVIALLVYKIVKSRTSSTTEPVEDKTPPLPKLRRDFTVEELRKYNGCGPDGRLLIALNGNIYDVTRGRMFYGPGGPYEKLGGRDASRSLATFILDNVKDEYDDISDLGPTEMNTLMEWVEQFKERYDYVGKLLKPGEEPTNYSDEEDEGSQQETEGKPKSN